MALVVPLRDATDLSEVGGKAYNLARAAAAGISIPTTAVLVTRAWRLFVGDIRMPAQAGTARGDDNAVFRDLMRLRKQLHDRPVPPEVVSALNGYLESRIRPVPIALRSSGVAEDSSAASFAGQLASVLNVVSPRCAAAAVRHCWLSGVRRGTVEYQLRHAIDEVPLPVAVVIQDMVSPSAAGVLLSRNPVSGDPNEIWIASGFGLGTTVVDGSLVPDLYVVDRARGATISTRLGRKTSRDDANADGGIVRTAIGPEQQSAPSLSPQEVHSVWALGMRVEAAFGEPVDVEWAVADGDPILLQTRPTSA